jgi:hypothetical protein
MSCRAAADALAKKIRRYEAAEWRRDRQFKVQPTLTGLHAELFRLMKIGQPLSKGTIRRALAHETHLLVSHEHGDDAAATDEERYGSHVDEIETDPRPFGNSADVA